MKFISDEKMERENLDWGIIVEPNEHANFWHHEIVDGDGQVYIGVIYDDGAVETAHAWWDSMETFERFKNEPLMHHCSQRMSRTLHANFESNELFCEYSHRNSSDTDILRVEAPQVLKWFSEVSKHDVIQLPKTGHICISLPPELKDQIEEIAAAERKSVTEWTVGRLSQCAQDERSRASLAQYAERQKRFAAFIEQEGGSISDI
jgi:hypothetical protein